MASWPPEIGLQNALSFNDDDYDEPELVELPLSSSNNASDKAVRRRSSKACDQCRKCKCKCERPSSGEPCKSCVILGTPCTFLGPSRKRGPPKGYIDAIEARLHQTEALLGIMLSSNDQRAQTLLRDLAQDPLAKDIIDRVDNSPYGVKGRKRSGEPSEKPQGKSRHTSADKHTDDDQKSKKYESASTHPSNEWQDKVSILLQHAGPSQNSLRSRESLSSIVTTLSEEHHTESDEGSQSPGEFDGRRQRRKLDNISSVNTSSLQPQKHYYPSNLSPSSPHDYQSSPVFGRRDSSPSLGSGNEGDIADAIGQLSLNEDEEVRYHGKASGLHLLGVEDRIDRRSEGGIWRFPKARVWPALPTGSVSSRARDDSAWSNLPPREIQDHLVSLYFTFVHPSFPVVHKATFFKAFLEEQDSPLNPVSDASQINLQSRRRHAPPLLLFAMFSIAARYSNHPSTPPIPPDPSLMWIAGDQYLDEAKTILDSSYASSRPSTCQALLLMGYREIGIGAMAQAWTYTGMAIRMAQDLGMHRRADSWARVGPGGRLFGEWELNERRRIWYTCVVLDKYVSSYIGRPLSIFERDFDTLLLSEDDAEEMGKWKPQDSERTMSVPARIISCFNSSATLSGILGMIIQAIYAVRSYGRQAESVFLEGLLDKWYLELPAHLRHEPGSRQQPIPLPHVLVLHMQYWCAVLLLHRPFIRLGDKQDSDDMEVRVVAEKSYELCAAAANHITAIARLYMEKYPIERCPVFLCYYLFSAGVMHVTTLSAYPSDPQARVGLTQCIEVLHAISIVWPSAGRARELLRGSKVNIDSNTAVFPTSQVLRQKRSAEQFYEDQQTQQMQPVTVEYGATNRNYINAPSYGYSPADSYSNVFSRWPAENGNSGAPQATFSTSLIPQIYSTGLYDDRGHVNRNFSSIESTGAQRIPQYWNDYSTYSQLDSHNFQDQAPVTTALHSPPSNSHLFTSEQYNI
ncbi:fungal-specific transcription factor domain-containing protein [Mycena floridula]|nr:fungal-specific transcription factor domain-containing protein [Mycena floridula]